MKGKKTGGRQRGTPNRLSGQLKDMILGALDEAGGKDYLLKQTAENPTAFLTLLGKVLPTQLSNDPDAPINPILNVTIG